MLQALVFVSPYQVPKMIEHLQLNSMAEMHSQAKQVEMLLR
jgi:hypothetical protein